MYHRLILVVTATAGFRHSSIETAEEVLTELAPRLGCEVQFARDEQAITDAFADLSRFRVVVFANTTGDLPLPLPCSM